MQLKDMTIFEVLKRGAKKVILEVTSVKFWGTCFVGYLNYRIIVKTGTFDMFGTFAFLALLGIREAADYLGKKS